MSAATVFATWFGAETVLSVSATFAKDGLGGIVADPFGSSFCLVFVALFFARAFYRMDLLTIGDFYRKRYSKPVEVVTAVAITASYLGWTSAQMTALGLVFSVLSGGALSLEQGIVLGAVIVLGYTIWGGMWSVAMTDLFQSVIILVGLAAVAWLVGDMAGGAVEGDRRRRRGGQVRVLPESGRQGMARLRRRLDDARHRLDPAAGRVPARHLGEEREDRDRRLPDRRRACTSCSPSCRSSSPTPRWSSTRATPSCSPTRTRARSSASCRT